MDAIRAPVMDTVTDIYFLGHMLRNIRVCQITAVIVDPKFVGIPIIVRQLLMIKRKIFAKEGGS